MKSVLEVIRLSEGVLGDRHAAEEVVALGLSCKRLDLYLQFDRPLNEDELAKCREVLKRRRTGEPIQQIEGKVEFAGCLISVTPDVLIPRPETEELVSLIEADGEVWDLCCGSGAIGIALKKKFPSISVTSSDLSEKALEVATANAEANNVEVEFLHGDLFAPFGDRQADLIISNPPYVAEGEWSELDSGVKDFEPKMALVSGPTGLEVYERIKAEYGRYLKPGGRLYLEIGATQGAALQKIFGGGKIERDLFGKERFFFLEKEAL